MSAPASNYMAWLPYPVRHARNVSPAAKLLYAELTTFTDTAGQCRVSNAQLSELFEASERAISRWLSELQSAQFLSIFLNGPERILTMNFAKKADKKTASKRSPILSTKVDNSVYQRSPILSTNTLYSFSSKEEYDIHAQANQKNDAVPAAQITFTPPTLEDVKAYASMHAIKEEVAEKFYHYYEAINWELREGVFIKKWQHKLVNWKLEEQARADKQAARPANNFGVPPAPAVHTSHVQAIDEVKRQKMKDLYVASGN